MPFWRWKPKEKMLLSTMMVLERSLLPMTLRSLMRRFSEDL